MKNVALFALLVHSAVAYCAEPSVLIFQKTIRENNESRLESDIAAYFSEELSTNFKFQPIVWAMSDPVFRDYVYDGVIPAEPNPTDAQLFGTAQKIKAHYVVVISIMPKADLTGSTIQLFKPSGGKPIWQRNVNASVVVAGNTDREQVERSLARSWAIELKTGPFKNDMRGITTPIEPIGQGSTITPDPTPVPPVTDRTVIRAQAESYLKSGDSQQAIKYLYQQVDIYPTDPEVRAILVDMLINLGLTSEAEAECAQAISLFPASLSFRYLYASVLLDLGRAEDAANEINEYLARGGDPAAVSEIKGRSALARGDYAGAREAFLGQMAKQPTSTIQALLALTVAFEGDTSEARRLIDTLQLKDDAEFSTVYRRFIAAQTSPMKRIADDLREVLRLSRLQPGVSATVQTAQRAYKSASALSGVLDVLRVPAAFKESHAKRVLAHKLLAQATAQILQFARTGDPEVGDEATISLTEALTTLKEANEMYGSE